MATGFTGACSRWFLPVAKRIPLLTEMLQVRVPGNTNDFSFTYAPTAEG